MFVQSKNKKRSRTTSLDMFRMAFLLTLITFRILNLHFYFQLWTYICPREDWPVTETHYQQIESAEIAEIRQ